MNGFYNINKQSGVTSNFVLTQIKKKLQKKIKVGHMGTLDPLASGVLPVAVGSATKLFNILLNKTKTYIATFVFGAETNTLDADGVIKQKTDILPNKEQIEKEIQKFIGKFNQIPPQFSAKSVNGVRAYDLARKGIEVELKSKEIEIYKFVLLEQLNAITYKFEIECSSGTYIRSICRDLAKKLNSLAYMAGLIRTQSGFFKIDNAVEIDNLNIVQDFISIDDVLYDFDKIEVNDKQCEQLKNGMHVKIDQTSDKIICVYCCNKLLGIGKIEEGYLKLSTHLY